MRVVKDRDGDLWEEDSSDLFECKTEVGIALRSLAAIEVDFGVATVYESSSTADLSVYKVTYESGAVKYASRRSLAGIIANRGYSYQVIAKVERAPEVEWSDVTEEFLGA